MKYMGSKNRIAKYLIPIMIAEADKVGITTWVEPFVGGANLIDKVPSKFKRIGYDINEHVIMALIDIRDNVDKLPTEVSEECYKSLRGTPPASMNISTNGVLSNTSKETLYSSLNMKCLNR